MIKISVGALTKASANRPDGYYHDIISRGKVEDGVLLLEPSVYSELQNKYRTARKTIAARIEPIPSNEWPIWAKALKQFSKPEDKGIGDVVARIIGDEKSEAFKTWHYATFGKPCNCTARQARWNRLYPLP